LAAVAPESRLNRLGRLTAPGGWPDYVVLRLANSRLVCTFSTLCSLQGHADWIFGASAPNLKERRALTSSV